MTAVATGDRSTSAWTAPGNPVSASTAGRRPRVQFPQLGQGLPGFLAGWLDAADASFRMAPRRLAARHPERQAERHPAAAARRRGDHARAGDVPGAQPGLDDPRPRVGTRTCSSWACIRPGGGNAPAQICRGAATRISSGSCRSPRRGGTARPPDERVMRQQVSVDRHRQIAPMVRHRKQAAGSGHQLGQRSPAAGAGPVKAHQRRSTASTGRSGPGTSRSRTRPVLPCASAADAVEHQAGDTQDAWDFTGQSSDRHGDQMSSSAVKPATQCSDQGN